MWMLQGPVGSPYPGKYIMFAVAALFAVVCWRSSRYAARTWREQRMNEARGVSYRPDTKKSVGANIAVALVSAVLLTWAMMAIYMAWPN